MHVWLEVVFESGKRYHAVKYWKFGISVFLNYTYRQYRYLNIYRYTRYIYPVYRFFLKKPLKHQGPVVQSWFSINPGLKFNPLF